MKDYSFSPPNRTQHIPFNSSLWRNLTESLFGSSEWGSLQSWSSVFSTHPSRSVLITMISTCELVLVFHPSKGWSLSSWWLLVLLCSAFTFIVFTFPLLSCRHQSSQCSKIWWFHVPSPHRAMFLKPNLSNIHPGVTFMCSCGLEMDFTWVLIKQPSRKGANLSKAAAHKQNK